MSSKPSSLQVAAFAGLPMPPPSPVRQKRQEQTRQAPAPTPPSGATKSQGKPQKSQEGGPRGKRNAWKGKAYPAKPKWTPKPREYIPTDKAKTVGEHFAKLFDADKNKIKRSQARATLKSHARTVWEDLICEASYRRSLTMEIADDWLVQSTGLSRMTVRKATYLLESLGMLKSVSAIIPGTKERGPFHRTLFSAGNLSGITSTAPGATAPDAEAAKEEVEDRTYDNATAANSDQDTAADAVPSFL